MSGAVKERLKVLVVHEIDFARKVVFEWQEFPEILDRMGHDVAVLDYDSVSGNADVRRWGFGPKRETVQFRLDSSKTIDLYRMIGPSGPVLRRAFAAASSGVVVRRVLDEFKPDVIMLYAVPTCGHAVVREAARRDVPVVFRSIDVLSELVPTSLAFGVHILERRVYPRCDRALVANPRLARYIDRISRGRTRTELMLSPVDSERFIPASEGRAATLAKLGIPVDRRVVVFVGSLFSFIGVGDVIERWGAVLAAVPDAHLLIVGGGPDEQRLRRLAAAGSESDAITFTGMRPYDEIPDLISVADVGICPFEILPVTRDINPIKVMQYLSCEVPCVCTPIDGTVQVLPEGESGVLYAEQGEQFTRKLAALLADPSRCERLGVAGRDWVMAHHSFGALAEQLVGQFRAAIDDMRLRAENAGLTESRSNS